MTHLVFKFPQQLVEYLVPSLKHFRKIPARRTLLRRCRLSIDCEQGLDSSPRGAAGELPFQRLDRAMGLAWSCAQREGWRAVCEGIATSEGIGRSSRLFGSLVAGLNRRIGM